VEIRGTLVLLDRVLGNAERRDLIASNPARKLEKGSGRRSGGVSSPASTVTSSDC
jgi:hypothetical protein